MARGWHYAKLFLSNAPRLSFSDLCVCVCVFFPSILDIKFVGRTSRGHTGVFCYSCSFLFVVFCVCVFLLLSLELGRCSSDLFLSSRPRTGLATTCITGYG